MSVTYNLPNRNRYEKSTTKKLRIDKNRCNGNYFFKKVILSAYQKLLTEKHVFFKSKPLKIWNFGRNEKVLSWCDNLKKQENPKKVIFSAHGKLLAEKHAFLKIKTIEDMKFW